MVCVIYIMKMQTNHQGSDRPLVGLDAIRKLFTVEFGRAEMVCQIEILHGIRWLGNFGMEWSFRFERLWFFSMLLMEKILFQRGYFDQPSFFRVQGLSIPENYLKS